MALVDDFSRFLLGIRAVPTREAVPILEALAEAVELCGVPQELMTDNGTPFVTIVRTMLSRFQRTLAELAAAHTPYAATVRGLALWHYRGGPWEPAAEFAFRG